MTEPDDNALILPATKCDGGDGEIFVIRVLICLKTAYHLSFND